MFERYAIFYTPAGALADWGGAWLGWDSAAGCVRQHPWGGEMDIRRITSTPRKYGFHATLKAPFRLHPDMHLDDLISGSAGFAERHCAFDIGALELRHAHGFVGLRPMGAPAGLQHFAADTVRAFDRFRAPHTEADIARRRKSRLTSRQDQQMLEWGYPFIFEDFNFHFTLSGRMQKSEAAQMIETLSPELNVLLPRPFWIDSITVMGEDADGFFHQIKRFALAGAAVS